ncbi:MAG: CHAT domain-containing protein [Smithella sp.]
MAHLYQIASDDFILFTSDQTVAAAKVTLIRMKSAATIVRRVCGQVVYYYLYPTSDFINRLTNSDVTLTLETALDLHEGGATPTLNAYDDAALKPMSCVVLHGNSVMGFYEAAFRAPHKGGGPVMRSARYLNAGFFPAPGSDNGKPVSTDQPLALDGGPYCLGVNVGEFWGLGSPGASFPEDLLALHFEKQSELELDMLARSFDVGIAPPHQKISVPKTGNSRLIFFDLSLSKTGRQAIDVDLIFQGHLLQSRRVEVFVISRTGDSLADLALPVQDGYITFTRTAALEWNSVGPLGATPSRLTIVAERDLDYNRIGLRFYNTTGADLGFQQSTLTEASLTTAMAAVRKQLALTMQAYSGTGHIGSTEKVLEKYLGQLAEIGRSFYLALLPKMAEETGAKDEGQQLKVDLWPGMTIQVAPLSAQLSVPWEVLYERKAESYREGYTRLCPTFLTHGTAPEDCPGFADPSIVCPHGFWGYRYIIEQLPCRVDPHVSPPDKDLPITVRNAIPLRFNGIVYAKFNQLTHHWDALRAIASTANLEMVRLDNLADVRFALTQSSPPADIFYFYTHGGSDPFGKPYLEVGGGDQIKFNDLDAWGVDLGYHQPLVVLNACDSADYSPDNFENLVRFFCIKKAAGVIGTQCQVNEDLANAFTLLFFSAFFKQSGAGRALFEARHKLLSQLDPRGLVYSLFAAADVKLTKPVIV